MEELEGSGVHPALLSCIAAFLRNRQKAVSNGALSDWITLKGGVAQGITLGVDQRQLWRLSLGTL